MIKMIALDLDGTLAVADHQVLPATRAALQDLHDSGVEVVIATGRRYRTTRFVIDNLGFEVFAICNGGALVKTPEQKTLHVQTFDVAPIALLAREHNLTLFAQRDAHENGGADFVIDSGNKWNEPTSTYHINNEAWASAFDLTIQPPEFLVCGLFGDQSELTHLARELELVHPGLYNSIIVSQATPGEFYCEISQAHVNKWHGLQHLAGHLQVDEAHICTVGDELNDMPMITAVPHGVAMGNGHETLKENARFVCGLNTEDGILDVVAYINDVNKNFTTR